MQEITLLKKMKVIKFYLSGLSYDEVARRCGISKSTVASIIDLLKAGEFPEVSTIPEEIELLRELATDIKRSNLCPIKASIGLSVLERLNAMVIEPVDIEKCHTLLQALSASESDLPAMAKSILAIEEMRKDTGLSLQELEDRVVSLKKEADRLTPVSEQIKAKRKELVQLEEDCKSLTLKSKDLRGREAILSDSVDKLEAKEVRLRSHVIELEERARNADKQLTDARSDIKTLDKIGLSIEELGSFSVKLKEVAAHHDIKPQDFCSRLLKELAIMAKGLGLESLIKKREVQLDRINNEITKGQTEKESLHAYLKQLTVEKGNLENRIDHYRKQLANDIAALSDSSKKVILDINDSLKLGINNGLMEVDKLADEAIKAGTEVGKLEARIESLSWIKSLLALVRGENGLDDYQVRIVGLNVLRGMSLWLNEKHGSDLYLLKINIDNTIGDLEKWKSSTS